MHDIQGISAGKGMTLLLLLLLLLRGRAHRHDGLRVDAMNSLSGFASLPILVAAHTSSSLPSTSPPEDAAEKAREGAVERKSIDDFLAGGVAGFGDGVGGGGGGVAEAV